MSAATDGRNAALDRRRHLLPEMEGAMARWYARQRGTQSQLDAFRKQAGQLASAARTGAGADTDVLEVAPGPGYLAIEIARLGGCRVTGLDISRTMVEIARENAVKAGLNVDFRQGDATAMPFAGESFDLIVCQAAFKNFLQPVSALDEMHRVLRPGGVAVIQDMRRDATRADIAGEVKAQKLGPVNGLITRAILGQLRRRAYSAEQFEKVASASRFGTCAIKSEGIGIEVRLTRHD